jgi:hypothetical protein
MVAGIFATKKCRASFKAIGVKTKRASCLIAVGLKIQTNAAERRRRRSRLRLRRFETGRPLRAVALSNYNPSSCYGLAGGVIAEGDASAPGDAIAPLSVPSVVFL